MPGCFADNSTQRQLTHEVCGFGKGAWASLSRTYCGQQCQLANYSLAGVEAGHSCWCGDAVRSPAAALPQSACNESCGFGEKISPWSSEEVLFTRNVAKEVTHGTMMFCAP